MTPFTTFTYIVTSLQKCRVLNISEVRFKVSMAMSPSQRPRGVLGFWSSLMTALGNTENMPVSFHSNSFVRTRLNDKDVFLKFFYLETGAHK